MQDAATRVWVGECDCLALTKADGTVTKHMETAALEACFDLAYHTKHVATIFERVFGNA